MQTKTIKSFVSTLENINQPDNRNKYITYNGNNYELISDKRQKTLKTADIAAVAKQIFEELKVLQNTSDTDKGYSIIRLSAVLCDYTKRLDNSKKWYHRIASFFGFISKQEKLINQLMLDAFKEGNRLVYNPSQLTKSLESILELQKTRIKKLDEDSKLNLFEKSVLDSSVIPNITNRGGFGGTVYYWYEEYLQAFLKEKGTHYSTSEKQQWKQFINDLETSKKMHAATLVLLSTRTIRDKWIKLDPEHLSNISKMTADVCLDKINKLKAGERLFLPGGYEVQKTKGAEGHSVVYVIQKENNGNFSFDVINTGEGIVFSNILWKPNGPFRSLTKDVKYENIPGDILSHDFFQKLNTFNLDAKEPSMKGPLCFLEKIFGKNRKTTNGREHRTQGKGSCVYKSLSSTAKKILPRKMFLDFKVWLTEQEIQKMKTLDLGKIKRQKINQNDVNVWLAEANKVLEKRRQKALRA